MICKKCGTKFSDGVFCPECGARTTPVSGLGGEAQSNTWEDALQYSDEEGYNTKMYGPQGQLEEQRIGRDGIKIEAGGKKDFENKILILESDSMSYPCIQAGKNSKLEFKNCTLINNYEMSIEAESNVSMSFDHCFIKGNGYISENRSAYGVTVEFRNCAFDSGQMVEDGNCLITAENVYFENCFINGGRGIVEIVKDYSSASRSEFRNCVIINDSETYCWGLLIVPGQTESLVQFENCFIRSKSLLTGGEKQKLIIKNCYFDDYSVMYR